MMTKGLTSRKQTKYIAGIDGLRALAVLMVLAYHLQLPFAKGGLLGVTVFFVISGFLIIRILVSEIENTGTVDLRNFWIRRIRRLYPAILLMVTVFIFISVILNRVLFTKACSDLLSVVFGYNNWWQIFNNVSYFENAGAPSPFTHCWSLAIETQFYLIYPLLLIFLARFRNRKSLSAGITMILAVLSTALMWFLFDPSKDPSRVYYGTDTRVFSMLFGAFLAIISNNVGKIRVSRAVKDAIGTVSLLGLLYMMVVIDGYSSFLYRGGQVLASILAVLVIFSVSNGRSILGRILCVPPLKWLADRSYGIYLWHYPIILLGSGGKKAAWWVMLIEVLLTIFFSAVSYHFIETPIRHGIIGQSAEIIKSRPKTRRESRKRTLTLRRSIRALAGILTVECCLLLCVVFVPREKALNNIDDLEKQAENAKEITDQKIEQLSMEEEQSVNADISELSDEEILQNANLLLIGDSIALGATDEFYAVFPNSISDTAVSRYTTESFGIYDSYVNGQGWNGDGVIFALGTNGLLYDSLSVLREMLGPDRMFFVITARAPYASWEQSNNAEIYEFAETTDRTYLVDWYKASEGHGEYFIEDETHLTQEGTNAYIECIKEAVLSAYKGSAANDEQI